MAITAIESRKDGEYIGRLAFGPREGIDKRGPAGYGVLLRSSQKPNARPGEHRMLALVKNIVRLIKESAVEREPTAAELFVGLAIMEARAARIPINKYCIAELEMYREEMFKT